MLFIGVSSGNSLKRVREYAESVKTEWPIYVDCDRSFEKATVKTEISLQNIHQTLIVAKGTMHPSAGESADIKKEVGKGKWIVAPVNIPPVLIKPWQALEFGSPAAAVQTIKDNLASKEAAVNNVAHGLENMLKNDLAKQLAVAQQKSAAGRKWEAYKSFDAIARGFVVYPEAARATAEVTRLKADPAVKKELAARELLGKVQESFDSQTSEEKQAAKAAFDELAQKYADTEAAKAAKNIKIEG